MLTRTIALIALFAASACGSGNLTSQTASALLRPNVRGTVTELVSVYENDAYPVVAAMKKAGVTIAPLQSTSDSGVREVVVGQKKFLGITSIFTQENEATVEFTYEVHPNTLGRLLEQFSPSDMVGLSSDPAHFDKPVAAEARFLRDDSGAWHLTGP